MLTVNYVRFIVMHISIEMLKCGKMTLFSQMKDEEPKAMWNASFLMTGPA